MQDQLLNPMRPHRNLQERMPSLDRLERKLVSGFLRRYVQWAAKTGRHDRIAGAMELLRVDQSATVARKGVTAGRRARAGCAEVPNDVGLNRPAQATDVVEGSVQDLHATEFAQDVVGPHLSPK